MIWLQRFTELLAAAMNKGCHCFSTALTKSIESKAGAPYGVRPARPGSYLETVKGVELISKFSL